ncbi:MAG: hypothetical protein JXB03_06765 [Spirochaetales bacterium]|nr:hypothetical protein [Spirochaetales bacterium]
MNQEQVKKTLLEVHPSDEYFSVVFTGKKSRKVDGLYYPDKREILIHNKNMETEDEILYTALHEYAHHLHFTGGGIPVSRRSHTREFWNIFHKLLETAETKGLLKNVFRINPKFVALTQKIKEQYMEKNGTLMQEFGRLLCDALHLCEEYHVSFEDYVDREIGLYRHSAKTLMNVYKKDIDPALGYENMAALSRIRDDEKRHQAEKAFLSGQSPDRVLHMYKNEEPAKDPFMRLEAERSRLKKTISTLQKKLESIEAELHNISAQ